MNIWNVNVIVSRVVVRIPDLEKKSLVKIASPVYNCRMVEVHSLFIVLTSFQTLNNSVSSTNFNSDII